MLASIRSDRVHRSETDLGPSVTKPVVRPAESPFLVGVQEYRSRRSAVERLFRASCPKIPVSPGKRSPARFWPATGCFRPPGTPYAAVRTSSRGTACSPASIIPSGARNTPAQARLTLQARRAPRQSSEQAERNRASLRSSLVFRR